jgi:hypothetical protein
MYMRYMQAKRWRNLQQQVSLKSSLSNTRQSISATASSDQAAAAAAAAAAAEAAHGTASHEVHMNGAAAAAGHNMEPAAASSHPQSTALSVQVDVQDNAGPSGLQLRPSSLLGQTLKPIPSESLELSPFAVSSDGQLQQEELTDAYNDMHPDLPTVADSSNNLPPAASAAAAAAVVAYGQASQHAGISSSNGSYEQQQLQQYSGSLPLPALHSSYLPALSTVSSHSSVTSCSSFASHVSLAMRSSRLGDDIVHPAAVGVQPGAAAAFVASPSAAQAAQVRLHGSTAAAEHHSKELPPSPGSSTGTPQWQQQQQQEQDAHVAPARQRRVGRHEAAELAAMAAAEAAAAAGHLDSPFSNAPNSHAAAAASTDSAISMRPSVGAPHQPTPAAAAAAAGGLHSALTGNGSQLLLSLGSAAPSAASAAVGSAKAGAPVSLLVGMWKILTSYLQVTHVNAYD